MVCENCSVNSDMTSGILVLRSPREARSASSACVVERMACWRNAIVLASEEDCVDFFVAGQSEAIIYT